MKLPPGYVPGLLQQHKATAKGGFGERLLRQYGWTEGKGLGANETGMAEALKVKQKKDQTGVGAHGSEMWRDKWWEEAYAQSVATISGATAGTDRLPPESSSDSDSSDSDDSTAEVPAGPIRRTQPDGTSSSATEAEHKLAAQLAKDPWGRFGGRQGKLARIRAQEEAALKARLGAFAATSQSAAASYAGAAAAGAADSDAASPRQSKTKRRKREAAQLLEAAAAGVSAAAAAAEGAAQPKAKRRKGDNATAKAAKAAAAASPAQPRQPTAADLAAEAAAAAMRAFKPTPTTGWWGARRFVSAGALGSTMTPPEPQARDAAAALGFTEATQEGLYMALHNAKTSGKTGLGKGKGSGIIGGAKWEGKKTVIQDDEEAAASAETTYEGELPAAGDPSVAEPSVAAQRSGAAAEGEEPTYPRRAAPAKSFKYSKLVRKLLRQAEGQQLPLKQLAKQIRQHWASAAAEHGPPPDATSLKSILRVKLERIDGVALQGKQVVMTS